MERSGVRAINTDSLKPPNPNCPVCSVAHGEVFVDSERATLNDLVEGVLRLRLGYGEEISVSNEIGTVYDPDLDDNLPKKLSDLGIKNDSFVTVVDDDDDKPRVNLELVVKERYGIYSQSMFVKARKNTIADSEVTEPQLTKENPSHWRRTSIFPTRPNRLLSQNHSLIRTECRQKRMGRANGNVMLMKLNWVMGNNGPNEWQPQTTQIHQNLLFSTRNLMGRS